MGLFFIEIFLCFAICFVVFRCCGRIILLQQQQQQQQQGSNHPDNREGFVNDDFAALRRLGERMSQTRGGRRLDTTPPVVSESSIATRKELIELNIFVRQIQREESVKELSRLLVISRGGGDADDVAVVVAEDERVVEGFDEELGREHDTAEESSHTKTKKQLRDENNGNGGDAPPPSAPTPSAPPLPTAEVTPTTTPAAATRTTPTSAALAVGRLWRSFSRRHSDSIIVDNTHHEDPQDNHNNIWNVTTIYNTSVRQSQHSNRLECSICLEQYLPDDTIAWAKDGGDDPSSNTSSSNAPSIGCEHIFHKECLMAWLQDNDECPLCRRKVIHADARTRFAGW